MGAETITQIQSSLRNGSISVEQLIRSRLKAFNPTLNAFITMMPEYALDQAQKIDAEIAEGRWRLLSGVPLAVKDNISIAGIPLTCGSKILSGYISPYTATTVKKLEEHGAVVIGKTNMDEFAMGSSTETSAWGEVQHPNFPDRVPGGSSGGSAVAVAVGDACAALGSDTGGSIRQPSAFCGIVGMKPTYGRVSRFGLVAFASSFDQIGPMCLNTEDCARVLQAIAGFDPLDSTSSDVPVPDYLSLIQKDAAGMKVGVCVEYEDEEMIDDEIWEKYTQCKAHLAGLNIQIVPVSIPCVKQAIAVYYTLSSAEVSSNLSRFDGIRYGNRSESYGDFREYVKTFRSNGFGREVKRRILLGTFALSSGYSRELYEKAQRIRIGISEQMRKLFHEVDAILSPTSPGIAFKKGEMLNNPMKMYLSDIFTVPANLGGFPSISVPYGKVNGFPVGMQLTGDAFSEVKLFQLGKALEQP